MCIRAKLTKIPWFQFMQTQKCWERYKLYRREKTRSLENMMKEKDNKFEDKEGTV